MMWLSLLLTLMSAPTQEVDQQETFRFEVEVRTVYADVFVTRDGEPVTGLMPTHFEVLDNGVPQKAELLDASALPLSTMLLLDISGSVLGDRIEQLRAAAHAFIEGLEAEDEVGLMTFTTDMQLRKGLSSDFDSLHRVLEETTVQADTSLHDALFAGIKMVEARGGRPLIVLFTDGLDNMSWLTDVEVLDVLKESDAVVYAVAVEALWRAGLSRCGRALREKTTMSANEFLQGITKATGGKVWHIDATTNIKDVFLRILREMESRYLLSYEPVGVSDEGWHDLEINLRGEVVDEIRSRPGYLVSSKYRQTNP
jgi:VWFA-related protein